MLSTATFFSYLLGVLFASIILWVIFLRLGLRWAQVQGVTTRRIVLATVIVIFFEIVANIFRKATHLFTDLQTYTVEQLILLFSLSLGFTVLAPCFVIKLVFKTQLRRSVQAWLPTLLPTFAMILLLLFVLQPFIYEGFRAPTNSMAPTLLGKHLQGACQQCGQPNYCSPYLDDFALSEPRSTICEYFHLTQVSDVDKHVLWGDSFIVAKFLKPRRWDIVVFDYPEEPSKLYVKRLVGLPGEKIHIDEGSVWVNGEKITPPESLDGIKYSIDILHWQSTAGSSVGHPATLGEDEYYVLGDFSSQSYDSRLWIKGAPGHNPYAVPESHLRGVVTHIYWPPSRWRIFR